MKSPADAGWVAGPQHPVLRANDVHVWKARLDLQAPVHALLEATLSPDETARAERFHGPEHRARFTAARGILRDIVSRYTNHDAGSLRFETTAHGKPHLVDPVLRFNVSHSQGLALYAVTLGREVGVDVEAIDPRRNDSAIAERFFSSDERAALARTPADERAAAFFRCWTRKEAFLKAVGTGLSGSLAGFSVPVEASDQSFEVNGVWIRGFAVEAGFAAAIALQGADGVATNWNWRR